MSQNKKIIVTGGAGYIGGSAAIILKEQGYIPIILDNFSTSERREKFPFIIHEVDLTNLSETERVWKNIGDVYAVFHFAAKALVSESFEKMDEYLNNNIIATLNVARLSSKYGTRFLIHSSSSSVYGVPKEIPIKESASLAPVSPYGETKLISERILMQFSEHKKLCVANLRYFNPAGAISSLCWGENHKPETHLIPNIVDAAINKKVFKIFGNDYPTKDGTPIRDIIHVEDLVYAHIKALEWLENAKISNVAFNIGKREGVSVKEALNEAREVLNIDIRSEYCERRPGDSPCLIADTSFTEETLNWRPKSTLRDMILSHYNWKKHCMERGING